ncbi:MAG: methionyl-tRNA formyltransferase, partial [Candidatus Omnitrophica bacterium]|nr:methionyl-tRNA formyltransferase [Candidatus Omnitrophota bacterium]
PQVVLDMPANSAINVHPSLLPQYRGAAPINWAIINGDTVTGISIIRLNVRMDAGDVIARSEVAIRPEDNAVSLRARMITAGQELLGGTIEKIQTQTIVAEPQDPGRVSLAPKLTKELGCVRWREQTAEKIHNLARGLMPWPTAYTTFQGKTIKLLATSIRPEALPAGVPGEIVRVDKSGITVAAQAGAVSIHQLLPESSKPMSADEFVRGYHVRAGQRLGE